ncbi:MAG: hypothetical protein U1C53_03450, partial [Candidatus Veblenbacteria bacterium]|nr:hypothetical protein [Candidatus Veblenbacteria bacterium]
RPGNDANWTIQFVMPTLINENDTIVLGIDTIATADEFNLADIAEAAGASDFDLAEDTDGSPGSCSGTLTDETLDASAGAAAWGVGVNTTTDTITFTAPSGVATYIAASACVVIEIGTNATNEFTGVNQINNPSKTAAAGTADVNDVAISFTGNAAADSGTALVATVEGVTVSVTIDESLSVVLAEVAAASCPSTLPGTDKSDEAGHTDTAIDFGTLTSGDAFYNSCHQLTIGTNATDGYSTTVYKTQLLTAGSDTIAEGDCNAGSCTTTGSGLWTTTTENGFGYCMDDVTGDAAVTADGSGWTTAE